MSCLGKARAANGYDANAFTAMRNNGRPVFAVYFADHQMPWLIGEGHSHCNKVSVKPQRLRLNKVDAVLGRVGAAFELVELKLKEFQNYTFSTP